MKNSRCSWLAFCLIIVFALSSAQPADASQPATVTPFSLARRQSLPIPRPTTTTTEEDPPTQSPPVSNPLPNRPSDTPTPTPSPPTPTPPTPSPPVSSPPVSDTASPTTTTTPPPVSTPTTTTPPPTPTVIESAVVSSSTDAAGSAVEVTVTVPVTFTPSATSSTEPSSTSAASNGDSGGLGTGSIIGLSVAGGVAVIGIIAFIIWKVTRKRGFSDFDDSEAIKWPELNSHKDGGGDSVPLPTNNTGRSGFDTSTSPVVGGGLARTPSISSTAHTTRSTAPSAYSNVYNNSTPDLYHDPYAVPPLPHLNPNQPYRDDAASAAQAGYYDPYRGPVPSALHDPDGPPSATLAPNGQGWDHPNAGGEAIPMTQMAGRRSPGPSAGLGGYDAGRASPGPGMGRTMSPGPAMAYGGPGVGDPYGRRSPGPGQAYDVGRRSPGPYNAYGGP